MAIETEKTFQQEFFGVDAYDDGYANGIVEIRVTGNPRVPPEDKAAFLQAVEQQLREAYSWTAAQLGVPAGDTCQTQKPDADTSVLDVINKSNSLLRQAHNNFRKAQILLGAKTIEPAEEAEAIRIFDSLESTAALMDSLGVTGRELIKRIDELLWGMGKKE